MPTHKKWKSFQSSHYHFNLYDTKSLVSMGIKYINNNIARQSTLKYENNPIIRF